MDWDKDSNAWTVLISTLSESLYGRRELNDRVFDLINDDDSASAVGKYLLSIFRDPQWYVTFRVPFFKYNSLDLFDVVELIDPEMPAHFGTSSAAKPWTYGGSDMDINLAHYWKRAKRYRVQLEGKEVLWSIGQFPTLKLTARILPNNGIDPT